MGYVTHIWVGNKVGYVTSTTKETKTPACPLKKSKVRLKYLGYTNNITSQWPKKLNTGRLFMKPKDIKKKETPPSKNH